MKLKTLIITFLLALPLLIGAQSLDVETSVGLPLSKRPSDYVVPATTITFTAAQTLQETIYDVPRTSNENATDTTGLKNVIAVLETYVHDTLIPTTLAIDTANNDVNAMIYLQDITTVETGYSTTRQQYVVSAPVFRCKYYVKIEKE